MKNLDLINITLKIWKIYQFKLNLIYYNFRLLFVLIMSQENKMTKQDKLVLTITLAAIFGGVFFLGFIGLILNIFG